MSGFGAPFRTAMPMDERTRSTLPLSGHDFPVRNELIEGWSSEDHDVDGLQRCRSLPVVLQAVRDGTASPAATPRPPRYDGSGRRPARGHRGRRPDRDRSAAALAVAPPVRWGGADEGAAAHDLAVPRRRVRGRPLPPRGVRRRAGRHGAARGGALVRPARSRPRAGRASAARRRSGPRGDRCPVAHRMAVPRARVPARLLGRRHHALPAARGGRLRRAHRWAAHPLPGRCAWRARRRGRGARVAGSHGRPRGRRARARGDRFGRSGRGRRGAARVPARHGGAAGGRARHARAAVGSRWAGGGAGRRIPPDRDGGGRARVAEADGPDPRPAGESASYVDERGAARRRAPALRRRARRRRGRTRPLPLAGPVVAASSRRDAGRALRGVHGSGTRSRCGVRRDRGDRRRRARRPRVPRGAARRRPGRGPLASARLRPRREREWDDVHRQRGAFAAGRAAGRSAVHLRRRARVRVGGGRPARFADRHPFGHAARGRSGRGRATLRWRDATITPLGVTEEPVPQQLAP